MSRREGCLVGRGEKAVPGGDHLYPPHWGWTSPAEQLPEASRVCLPPSPPRQQAWPENWWARGRDLTFFRVSSDGHPEPRATGQPPG